MLLACMGSVPPGSGMRARIRAACQLLEPELFLVEFGCGGGQCQERLKSVSRSTMWGCYTTQSPSRK